MLNVNYAECLLCCVSHPFNAECRIRYTECRYAECRGAPVAVFKSSKAERKTQIAQSCKTVQ